MGTPHKEGRNWEPHIKRNSRIFVKVTLTINLLYLTLTVATKWDLMNDEQKNYAHLTPTVAKNWYLTLAIKGIPTLMKTNEFTLYTE